MQAKKCLPAPSFRGSPPFFSKPSIRGRVTGRVPCRPGSPAARGGCRELQPPAQGQARGWSCRAALTGPGAEREGSPQPAKAPPGGCASLREAAGRPGRHRDAGSRLRAGRAPALSAAQWGSAMAPRAPSAARPAALAQPPERQEVPAARPGSASSQRHTRAQRPAGSGDALATYPETLLPVRLNFGVQLLQGGGEAAEEQILPHQLVRALRCRRHGGPTAPPAPPAHGRGGEGMNRPRPAPSGTTTPSVPCAPLPRPTLHPPGASSPRFFRLLIGRRRAVAACRLAARHVRLVLLGAGGGGAVVLGAGRGAVIDGRGVIDRRSERAIPEAPGAAPHRLPPAGPRLPTSDGAAGAGTLTSGLCLRSVARQGALIQWKAGKGFPGGRLRLWRAWLGLDLPSRARVCLVSLPTPMCHSLLGKKRFCVVKKPVI